MHKSTTDSSNSPKHTVGYTQTKTAAFMKLMNCNTQTVVKALLLNESDLMDTSVVAMAQKIINGPNGVNMKEIVVNKNQIIQLRRASKCFVRLPMETMSNRKQPLQPLANIKETSKAVPNNNDDVISKSFKVTSAVVLKVGNKEQGSPSEPLNKIESSTSVDSSAPKQQISICRTCLKPTLSSTCHKLYDVGENHKKCSELRQNIVEVTESIDLLASLNPMICNDCFGAINIAFAFRNRVKAVEEQINKRRKGIGSVIDLKSMLEEIATKKLGKNDKRASNLRKRDESSELNLEQYLAKRKKLIGDLRCALQVDGESVEDLHVKTRSGSNDRVPGTRPTTRSRTAASEKKNRLPGNNNTNSAEDVAPPARECPDQRLSVSLLKDLITNGHSFIEIINDDGDCPRTIPNEEFSDIFQKPNVPASETVEIQLISDDDDYERTIPNAESSNVLVKPNIPVPEVIESSVDYSDSIVECLPEDTESLDPILDPSTGELKFPRGSFVFKNKTTDPISNRFAIREATATNPTSVAKKIEPSNVRWQRVVVPKSIDVGVTSSLEQFLADRQKKCMAMAGAIGGEKKKKKEGLEDAYNDLTKEKEKKGRGGRKRKPWVPDTYNLFDEDHDTYFEQLEGEAGYYMVRKWLGFSRLPSLDGIPPFLCESCGEFFPERGKLKQHLESHSEPPTTICQYCGLEIGSDNIKLHISRDHTTPPFQCKECGQKCRSERMLSCHVSQSHTIEGRKCLCQKCGAILTRNSLRQHLKRHATSNVACEICKKVFKNQLSWCQHYKTHLPAPGGRKRRVRRKTFTCQICSKTVTNRRNLDKHMRAYHEGTSNKCKVCGKFLLRSQSMARHLKIAHRLRMLAVNGEARKIKRNGEMSDEREVQQATDFISNLTENRTELEVTTEIQGDSVYERFVDAPTIMEKLELQPPKSTEELGLPASAITEETEIPTHVPSEETAVQASISTEEIQIPTFVSTAEIEIPASISMEEIEIPPPMSTEEMEIPGLISSEEIEILAPVSTEDMELRALISMEEIEIQAPASAEEIPASVSTEETATPVPIFMKEIEIPAPVSTEETEIPASISTEKIEIPSSMSTEEMELRALISMGEIEISAPVSTEEIEIPAPMFMEDIEIPVPMSTEEIEIPARMSRQEEEITAPISTEDIEIPVPMSTEEIEIPARMSRQKEEITAPISTEEIEIPAPMFSKQMEISVPMAMGELEIAYNIVDDMFLVG